MHSKSRSFLRLSAFLAVLAVFFFLSSCASYELPSKYGFTSVTELTGHTGAGLI